MVHVMAIRKAKIVNSVVTDHVKAMRDRLEVRKEPQSAGGGDMMAFWMMLKCCLELL